MNKPKSTRIRNVMLCAIFASLIAVGAFIKISVPYVPFTLQILFTNLAALLLGKKLGTISVAVYLMIGLAGFPVFTAGGGIGYVFHPTFGYLLGFAAGTFAAGVICGKARMPSRKTMILAGFANMGIVYTFGMVYYYIILTGLTGTTVGLSALLLYNCIIFIPGDAASCLLGVVLARRLRPVLYGE